MAIYYKSANNEQNGWANHGQTNPVVRGHLGIHGSGGVNLEK
jgi:hypothetical protein